jgi:hypothetical protein
VSRHHRFHPRPSTITIGAAAGTVAAACAAAVAISATVTGPPQAATGGLARNPLRITADAAGARDHGAVSTGTLLARQAQTARSQLAISQTTTRHQLVIAREQAARRAAQRRAAARRAALAAARAAAARQAAARRAATARHRQIRRQPVTHPGTPQQIAMAMLGSFGWSSGQFGCLNSLWAQESNWNVYAQNPYSGAYGIPQALPGSKMASAGADWQTSAVTQIRWGLGYIRSVYGTPCGAWSHETGYGWY